MEPRHYNILSQRELGRYLRYYRKKAGFTAKQMAQQLGYASHQSIFNIEGGKSTIAPQKMYDYLAMCGIDPDEAFTEPFSEVDSPDRHKKPGSMLLQELTDIFRDLDSDNQKTVVKVARWALKAQNASNAGSNETM